MTSDATAGVSSDLPHLLSTNPCSNEHKRLTSMGNNLSRLSLKVALMCSLAEELVMAAQAVESGKGLERKLSSLQTEHSKVRHLQFLL